jgi:hypothetical protein
VPFNAAASQGTLLHELFQADATSRLTGNCPLSDTQVEQRIQEFLSLSPEQPRWWQHRVRDNCWAIFTSYRLWAGAGTRSGRKLVGVELSFDARVQVPGACVVVRGRVDRLERDQQGRLVVIDFKTGRRGSIDPYLDQLACYAVGAQQGNWHPSLPPAASDDPVATGGAAPELVWPALTRARDPYCRVTAMAPLDQEPHRDIRFDDPLAPNWFIARLSKAALLLGGDHFDAWPGDDCRSCPFRDGCPGLSAERVNR